MPVKDILDQVPMSLIQISLEEHRQKIMVLVEHFLRNLPFRRLYHSWTTLGITPGPLKYREDLFVRGRLKVLVLNMSKCS
jgi:hypothetical protein